MSKPRIGYRMAALADYVSAVPGCNRAEALRGVGLNDRGMGAHRPLDRAILAGLVIAEQPSGRMRPVPAVQVRGRQAALACVAGAARLHGPGAGRRVGDRDPRASAAAEDYAMAQEERDSDDQWGYVDPAERVHEEQVMWNMAQPMAAGFGPPQWTPPVQSPLDLSNVPAIMFGNGNTTPRYRSPLEAAVIGAVLGGLFDVWRAKRGTVRAGARPGAEGQARDRRRRVTQPRRSGLFIPEGGRRPGFGALRPPWAEPGPLPG